MKNKSWYYSIIIDTRQSQTLNTHSAVNKIINFLKDVHLIWIYNKGDIEVISDYDNYSITNSNSIIYSATGSVTTSDTEKQQAVKDEEELALYLFRRINSHLPFWVKDEHIIAVFYYNMIKDMPYKDMVKQKLYSYKKTQFYKDKQYVYKLCADAWCLSRSYNNYLDLSNYNLIKIPSKNLRG